MDNQPDQQDPAPQQELPRASAPAPDALPTAPADPWLAYLTDEKASAKKLIRGMRKGAIRIPDDAARQAFAGAVLDAPGRVKRLLALMRESVPGSETIGKIV